MYRVSHISVLGLVSYDTALIVLPRKNRLVFLKCYKPQGCLTAGKNENDYVVIIFNVFLFVFKEIRFTKD